MARRLALAALILGSWLSPAHATGVFVISIARDEVQLMVDQRMVYRLKPGASTPEGVRLLGIAGNSARLEIDGRRVSLSLGGTTVSQSDIRADRSGHFVVTAFINDQPVRSMIDTGATRVSLNRTDAQRLGIDLASAQRGVATTANGDVDIFLVTLPRVRVGGITLTNVPGQVIDGGPERLSVALIGMSFLRHVDMRRSGDTLTLIHTDF